MMTSSFRNRCIATFLLIGILAIWGVMPAIAQYTPPEDRCRVLCDSNGNRNTFTAPIFTMPVSYGAKSCTSYDVTSLADTTIAATAGNVPRKISVQVVDTDGPIRVGDDTDAVDGDILDPSPAANRGGGYYEDENYRAALHMRAVVAGTTVTVRVCTLDW